MLTCRSKPLYTRLESAGEESNLVSSGITTRSSRAGWMSSEYARRTMLAGAWARYTIPTLARIPSRLWPQEMTTREPSEMHFEISATARRMSSGTHCSTLEERELSLCGATGSVVFTIACTSRHLLSDELLVERGPWVSHPIAADEVTCALESDVEHL